MLGRVVGLFEQQFRAGLAELVLGLAHGRQRHGRIAGEVDVVVADDRHVTGHLRAELAEPAQQAEGQQVVGAEGRGGGAHARHAGHDGGAELVARVGAAAGVHGRDRDLQQDGGRIEPGLDDGLVRATAPVRALPDRQRAVEERDAPVAQGEQVRDRELTPPPVIDRDRALPGGTRPVEQHHRGTTVPDAAKRLRPALHRRNEDAAYPLFLQYPQVLAFLRFGLVGVAEDHGVALGLGEVLGAPRDLGEERVRHVQDYEPEAPAAARPELARRGIGDEPQLLHRRFHPRTGLRPDQMRMVQHVGDRADSDPRQGRHVFHAGSHRSSIVPSRPRKPCRLLVHDPSLPWFRRGPPAVAADSWLMAADSCG